MAQIHKEVNVTRSIELSKEECLYLRALLQNNLFGEESSKDFSIRKELFNSMDELLSDDEN